MHVAWGVVLLRIALRHVSVEATLAELGRNEALRRLIGIETAEGVPRSWNISRFLDTLGQEPHRSELQRIFDAMVERLGAAVPDLGKDTAGKSYGKTVRVDRTIDLRRFPPIPRATKKFERLYDGRTSVERVNARLKIFWGVDDGNLVGARRFRAMVGAVLVVHVAFATLLAAAPRREGTLGKLRLGPIQKALQPSTA